MVTRLPNHWEKEKWLLKLHTQFITKVATDLYEMALIVCYLPLRNLLLVKQLALASSHCILILTVIRKTTDFLSHSTDKKPCKETMFGRRAAYETVNLSKCSYFGGRQLISRAASGAKAPQHWSCWTEHIYVYSHPCPRSLPGFGHQKHSS